MNVFLKALGQTRVYALTDRKISSLSLAQQVVELSDCGARVIQLREKELSASEFFAEAAAAMQAARQRGVQIIINDRVDIALALNADGVHLGQEDLPPAIARRLLGPKAIIGFSTHSLKQAKLAAQLPIDYVALGPIFHTTTKNSCNPPLGEAVLRTSRQVLGDIPLVAIGGITEMNTGELLDAGAAAVAIIGGLWKSGDTGTRRRLLQL